MKREIIHTYSSTHSVFSLQNILKKKKYSEVWHLRKWIKTKRMKSEGLFKRTKCAINKIIIKMKKIKSI